MAEVADTESRLGNHDYTVGWMCALKEELAASRMMLDQEHPRLPRVGQDTNSYILGSLGPHNIVLASLPSGSLGAVPATNAAANMLRSFPNIRFGLMVGIGGGVPGPASDDPEEDIRLGDVVVSHPTGTFSGVVQYDFGRMLQEGNFERVGSLNRPPTVLMNAVNDLRARHEFEDNQIVHNITKMLDSRPRMRKRYKSPGVDNDVLFRAEYPHANSTIKSCQDCDHAEKVDRQPRDTDDCVIHYGVIGSANEVMKDSSTRERLRQEIGALCLEMEAAGLMNDFPCLVIRGISDYCDSHKNDIWQPYAAAVAAAYTKELLGSVSPSLVNSTEAAAKQMAMIEEIHTMTKQTQSVVQSLEKGRYLQEIRDWLLPPDPSMNFNKALEQRHAGSGLWFLEGSRFATWKTERNSFLWLHGIPGCGKTILTASIVQSLKDESSHHLNLIYFFFDFRDSEKQAFDPALRALISQLYAKNESARQPADTLFSTCRDESSQPSTDALRNVFDAMLQRVEETWIVLDALDECSKSERSREHGLLSQIERWLTDQQSCVHLLVTSRPEYDIQSALQSWVEDRHILPIESDLVAEDIRAFIHTEVRFGTSLSRWRTRPEVQDEIENTLSMKANGMFRWVTCQLNELKDRFNYPLLQAALQTLPPTLDETYARILNNIPEPLKPCTYRLLQFLTYSERPLLLVEAVDVIAIDPSRNPRFDPKFRIPEPEEISLCCSSLVSILVRDELEVPKEGWIIQLAHFSVKEYFVSDRADKDICSLFEETAARTSIAGTCVTYLLELNHDLSASQIQVDYPLVGYSAQFWFTHARAVETSTQDSSIAMQLFDSNKAYATCSQLAPADSFWMDEEGEYLVAPLYYASAAGLVSSVRTLIKRRVDVNARSGEFGNALVVACAAGNEEIVKMLVASGANINEHGGQYGNALQTASCFGKLQIVDALLAMGADPNAEGGKFGNALHAAIHRRHIHIMELLLEKGADINAQVGPYGNALQTAIHKDKYEIVERLVARGADVNAQGGLYGTALQTASYKGDPNVADLLVAWGAQINTQKPSGQYGSALQAACWSASIVIVDMLLKKGADVDAQGGEYGTAFKAASEAGSFMIMEMLLEKGASLPAEEEWDSARFYNFTGQTTSHTEESMRRRLFARR